MSQYTNKLHSSFETKYVHVYYCGLKQKCKTSINKTYVCSAILYMY